MREAVRRWRDTPLAVRSSSAAEDLPSASYAGLYTTVLDVNGEDELMAAVRRCWASAFGDVVRSYHPQLASERPRSAVLIQPMVRAQAAGVAFTANPVTGDPDAVMVEAVLGTGERLVSGAATPDEWVVRGDSAVRRGSGDEAIDAAVARAVAALARQVEQHQGRPQDVEWALAGETVVLLQARPITALHERPTTRCRSRSNHRTGTGCARPPNAPCHGCRWARHG